MINKSKNKLIFAKNANGVYEFIDLNKYNQTRVNRFKSIPLNSINRIKQSSLAELREVKNILDKGDCKSCKKRKNKKNVK